VPTPPEPAPLPAPIDLGVRILSGVGFATPESVVHDPAQDVYFVSNINGSPTDKDDNGFISRVTPEGEVSARWLSAETEGVELNAPKGLAVHAGVLYVTDIDTVRMFDAASGAPKGAVVAKDATFLNAIKAAEDGTLVVSDSGLRPDFSSSGTDTIYRLEKGKLSKLLASKKLTGPNGVLPDGQGGAWVVTFGGKELYRVGRWGKLSDVQTLPAGALDGLVRANDGRLLVSSWESSSVLAGVPGGEFVELLSGLESPADLGYDAKRDRLLVPLFKKDTVVLHDLAPPAAAPAPVGNSAGG
jgi:sugar lactone lactonase YvrE